MEVNPDTNKNEHPDIPSPNKRQRKSLISDSPPFYDFSKVKTLVNKIKQQSMETKPTMFSSPSVLISRSVEIKKNQFELKLQSIQKRPTDHVTSENPLPIVPQKTNLDNSKLMYTIPKAANYEPNDPHTDHLNFQLIENIKVQNKNLQNIINDLERSA